MPQLKLPLPPTLRPHRAGSLLLALLLALPAQAQQQPVMLEADSVSDDGGTLRADGNVKVRFDGRELCAGNIVYDRATGLISAVSDVRLTSGNDVVNANAAHVELESGSGKVDDFHADLAESGLRVSGKSARWGADGISAEDTRITSCPSDSEDWRLRAFSAETNSESQELIAQNAVLEIANIPVFYLPYGRFYYGDESRNGFLVPRLRFGTDRGTGLTLPYYLSLADNYDVTFTSSYQSEHGLELASDFRFLLPSSSGEMRLATVFDNGKIGSRGRGRLNYRLQDGNWRVFLTAEDVSDDDYLLNYADGDETLLRHLPRSVEVHYEYGDIFASATADHFRTLDDALTAPHRALPQIVIGGSGGGDVHDWQAIYEYARFRHNTANGGTRHAASVDGRATWRIGDVSLSPSLGMQALRVAPDVGDDVSLLAPKVRLDAEQTARLLFTDGVLQRDHLRLRAAAVYVAARTRQNRAPLFDTVTREQNSENLFESNRFVGGDRIADARFVAYGGSYRLFSMDGDERFFAGVAQRYHFGDAKIKLPSNDSPPTQGFGNILLNSRIQLGGSWRAAASAEWDSEMKTFSRFYTDVNGAFGEEKLVHLRYLADEDESLALGAGGNVVEWLDAATKVEYLLDKDRFSRSQLALRLRDSCNCWNISFTVSDTVVEEGDNETRFSLGVELVGLGNLGNDYTELLNDLR